MTSDDAAPQVPHFKTERLITPLAVMLITFGVVFIPAERSGWDLSGVVNNLTVFATIVAIFSVMTIALNVQWGYTGLFNFGIAGFFMLGAYTAAIFTLPPAEGGFETYVGGFGEDLNLLPMLDSEEWLPFIVAMAAAALVCGLLAFLLSIPTLNLREDYLAIATIGVAELLRNIAVEERDLVNGSRALNGIPRPFSGLFDADDLRFVFLAFAVLVLIVVFLAVERGIRSPWGRVLRALREDELATAASGKNVFSFKTQGFVFGAMLMGIGGAVYAFQSRTIAPDSFSHYFATFLFWAMLIVGGSGNNKGAILGAYVIWGFYFISIQLQGYDLPDYVSQTRISATRDVLIGALIVIVLLLRPQGLLPEERTVSIWMDRLVRRARRRDRLKVSPGSTGSSE
jgi:branched-chain amino acid transport system permease protein